MSFFTQNLTLSTLYTLLSTQSAMMSNIVAVCIGICAIVSQGSQLASAEPADGSIAVHIYPHSASSSRNVAGLWQKAKIHTDTCLDMTLLADKVTFIQFMTSTPSTCLRVWRGKGCSGGSLDIRRHKYPVGWGFDFESEVPSWDNHVRSMSQCSNLYQAQPLH